MPATAEIAPTPARPRDPTRGRSARKEHASCPPPARRTSRIAWASAGISRTMSAAVETAAWPARRPQAARSPASTENATQPATPRDTPRARMNASTCRPIQNTAARARAPVCRPPAARLRVPMGYVIGPAAPERPCARKDAPISKRTRVTAAPASTAAHRTSSVTTGTALRIR